MPAPGDMLSDNLVLEREIGSGGMGAVWIAKNAALGTHVAVKLLRSMGGDVSAEARKRFEAEARGLAQLDHPNLVRIFDFGISVDGDPYIVMELLRGQDLGQRLGNGPLDAATTADVLRQTSKALGRAHEAGVIHRDIKPANIFLVESDGELIVKVLDFGVARFGDAALDMSTKTGALIGTPFFMSPEQHMNPKGIDHRADLWSLAVVVYACLTAKLPFTGETITSLGVAVLDGKRPTVRSLRPELPLAIDMWMDRALAKDPAQRYQSAKELADAFDRARAASASYVPSTPSPVSAGVASASLSMGATNGPPLSIGAAATLAAPHPQAHVQPARKSSSAAIFVIAGLVGLLALGAGGWFVFGRTASGDASPSAASTSKSKHARAPAADASSDAAPDATTASPHAATATSAPTARSDPNQAPSTPAAAAGKPTPGAPTDAPTATKSTPTATATTVATSAPKSTRSAAPASGVMQSCWRGNADKGTPASNASVSFHVDSNGGTSVIVVSGPARSVGAFTACTVQGVAALNLGPGNDEQLSASASFAAVK